MEVKGYKSFNKYHKNKYGIYMEEGKTYHTDGVIKFGLEGNEFHFCKYLEDTIKYQMSINDELINPVIAKVTGYGKIVEYNDNIYDYYNQYVAEYIKIDKFLKRKEIIDYALNLGVIGMYRFVTQYKLTNSEIKLFKGKYLDIDLALLYHQKEEKETYNMFYSGDSKKVLKLIKNI